MAVALLVLHVLRRPGAPTELQFDYYTDHHRHLRYAWESLRIGPAIYVTNMNGMKMLGDGLAFNWMNTAYLYPPGALLFFMPLSQLAYRGVVSFDHAATALVFVFGLSAVWSALRVWRCGQDDARTAEGTILWGLFALCLLLHALSWGLHGQYDAVVVLVLVVAAVAKTPSRRVLWLGIAFFFKFQALLFLPFFVRDLLVLYGQRRASVLRDPAVVVSCVLTAFTLGIAMWLGQHGLLSPVKQSPLHIDALFAKDRSTLVQLVFVVGFALVALVRGRWQAALVALWIFAVFAKLSLLQHWYIVYVYPSVLFVERRSRPWLATWCLGFVYLLHWLPDIYRELNTILVLAP